MSQVKNKTSNYVFSEAWFLKNSAGVTGGGGIKSGCIKHCLFHSKPQSFTFLTQLAQITNLQPTASTKPFMSFHSRLKTTHQHVLPNHGVICEAIMQCFCMRRGFGPWGALYSSILIRFDQDNTDTDVLRLDNSDRSWFYWEVFRKTLRCNRGGKCKNKNTSLNYLLLCWRPNI